jgi:hypothetical protein
MKKTSAEWLAHFQQNLQIKRVDFNTAFRLTSTERKNILSSLQAWQLGETSEGKNLLMAAQKYAKKINDPIYPEAVKLFIQEEQKHGNNLGQYLDLIGEPRIKKDWGDSLFRKIRYYNQNMELWTLAVITVESTAQIFYHALKKATDCPLLAQICRDILIDEAAHIHFQMERMEIIHEQKSFLHKFFSYYAYKVFFFCTILVVWFAHRTLFKSGNLTLSKYLKRMNLKYQKTLGKLSVFSKTKPALLPYANVHTQPDFQYK